MTQDTPKLRGKYPHSLIESCTEFETSQCCNKTDSVVGKGAVTQFEAFVGKTVRNIGGPYEELFSKTPKFLSVRPACYVRLDFQYVSGDPAAEPSPVACPGSPAVHTAC